MFLQNAAIYHPFSLTPPNNMTLPPSKEPLPLYEPHAGAVPSNINSPSVPEPGYSFSHTTVTKPTLSSRLIHSLGRNPGFCPGAFSFRRGIARNRSQYFPEALHKQSRSPERCLYCGLAVHKYFPKAFTTDYPNYPQLSLSFLFESHVPATRLDHSDRRSCLLCWEDKQIWIKPMNVEEWGAHTRKHFKEDGYQICTKTDGETMQARSSCLAKKCTKIHY
ncbi:hypothetical protein K491DRAFT_753164 [Lophiostoma macrostomum CBS 122681]|uniref:Uncharacterized protein n=1 Tax=Lophiostoma macrostomum CBS 122681 TaxID=1314788 RepID=A0A6A6TUG1_9PLEO|nr:hypothetical protein K491DRAFT_753164 [Lophiostoma macrostomum CBS 122681]